MLGFGKGLETKGLRFFPKFAQDAVRSRNSRGAHRRSPRAILAVARPNRRRSGRPASRSPVHSVRDRVHVRCAPSAALGGGIAVTPRRAAAA